jgi:DnaJ domain
MKEYYKILQVPFWASDEDIKKAYRVLVQQHHPDRNSSSTDAEMKIKEINEAYTILGNIDKRKEYDFKCIINNHYTSHQPETKEKQQDTKASFFSTNNAAAFSPSDDTLYVSDSNLLRKWKKVLWISVPVVVLITAIYFLLPDKSGKERTEAIGAGEIQTSTAENPSRVFTPASNASLVAKWQNDRILYKLSVWMPAGNNTPAEQSRIFFGDNIEVDFFDKEGFKVFRLPLKKEIMDGLWKRQDTLYTLSISEQATMPYSTYTVVSDWKINYSPQAGQGSFSLRTSGEKKSDKAPQYNSGEPLIQNPPVPVKSTKKKTAETVSNDILQDETIRNGYKKNK